MKISLVGSSAGSATRQIMMEIWRMSMTQRLMQDTKNRVNGQTRYHSQDIMVNSIGSEHVHSRHRPPSVLPVEPAVRVVISQQTRDVAKMPHHL